MRGSLAREVLGNDTDKKWSDLWYIWIPFGYEKTLAQMTDEERADRENNRNKEVSINAMEEFAEWYENKMN